MFLHLPVQMLKSNCMVRDRLVVEAAFLAPYIRVRRTLDKVPDYDSNRQALQWRLTACTRSIPIGARVLRPFRVAVGVQLACTDVLVTQK
jgi:hypothetical protein